MLPEWKLYRPMAVALVMALCTPWPRSVGSGEHLRASYRHHDTNFCKPIVLAPLPADFCAGSLFPLLGRRLCHHHRHHHHLLALVRAAGSNLAPSACLADRGLRSIEVRGCLR